MCMSTKVPTCANTNHPPLYMPSLCYRTGSIDVNFALLHPGLVESSVLQNDADKLCHCSALLCTHCPAFGQIFLLRLHNAMLSLAGPLFFTNLGEMELHERMHSWDRNFQILKSLPNVLITPHSAFLTKEALCSIAQTTIANLTEFKFGQPLSYQVLPCSEAGVPYLPAKQVK